MPFLIVLALAAVVTALVFLRRYIMRRDRREQDRLERMRSSQLYAHLQPVLKKSERYCVERIEIRPDGVTIALFWPMNKVFHFDFEARGIPLLERPESLQALTRLISMELPWLNNMEHYCLSTHRSVIQGQSRQWYAYEAQLRYRDAVLRALYDQPGMSG